jgi:hypothetical protein
MGRVNEGKMHTAREQIQVAISDKTRSIFGIFLPDRKSLDIFTYGKKYRWVRFKVMEKYINIPGCHVEAF